MGTKENKRKDGINKDGVIMVETWEELEKSIENCQKCKLAKTRQNIVFGVGNRNAKIMFIGEGPGADEDRLGEPFVGKAGKLMNMAFETVGLKREEVLKSDDRFGGISLDKLKKNIKNNIKGASIQNESTTTFPLTVKIDEYTFSINEEGEVTEQ